MKQINLFSKFERKIYKKKKDIIVKENQKLDVSKRIGQPLEDEQVSFFQQSSIRSERSKKQKEIGKKKIEESFISSLQSSFQNKLYSLPTISLSLMTTKLKKRIQDMAKSYQVSVQFIGSGKNIKISSEKQNKLKMVKKYIIAYQEQQRQQLLQEKQDEQQSQYSKSFDKSFSSFLND